MGLRQGGLQRRHYDAAERLLYVVFIERDDDVIRIISARLATKQERSFYDRE